MVVPKPKVEPLAIKATEVIPNTFRMLRMTDEKQGQVITSEEMLAQYDTKGIVLRRFEDLVYGGYMAKQGDQYSLTAKGKFILSIYRPTIDFLHMQKY